MTTRLKKRASNGRKEEEESQEEQDETSDYDRGTIYVGRCAVRLIRRRKFREIKMEDEDYVRKKLS